VVFVLDTVSVLSSKFRFWALKIDGLLICTLISENLGLEKSRSDSNLRNISGPGNLDFFRSPPRKKARFILSEKIQVTNKKKSSLAGPEIVS
jgi:hypothetical protein